MRMRQKISALAILLGCALGTLPILADTQPLPATFGSANGGNTTDTIAFSGDSFPSANLICVQAGCGGAFQATVTSGPAIAPPSVTLTTVWCVDYQLDVTYGSTYTANITALNDINSSTDAGIRYGTLDSVGNNNVNPATIGWTNTVTNPGNIDGGDPNSAAYRYTLAAALVGQYEGIGGALDPTNPDGNGSDAPASVNLAIQQAIWYVTYNNEYNGMWQNGTTWPPDGMSLAAGPGDQSYTYWVNWAEQNATTVNTSAWVVISGPAEANGTLDAPGPLNGIYYNYPSYQTFLAQVGGGPPYLTTTATAPEPTYLVLTFGLSGLIVLARVRKLRKQS